ncbi:hypothetical protein CHELA20_52356 [Hyphomicrobiales bacterium]|nr:hypothetical protein CHELA41_22565 [Hyphomicrobiales bacterium]CAH1681645.1 hypothetical protein CHELA20_52356 [Hyphomicrobiales bacterium]
MVRRIFLPAAPQGAAWHRRHLLRPPLVRRFLGRHGLHPQRRRGLSRDLPAHRHRQCREILDGRRPRGTMHSPGTLRRIQPTLRSRHVVRPEDGRQRGFHPVLDAAERTLALSAVSLSGRVGTIPPLGEGSKLGPLGSPGVIPGRPRGGARDDQEDPGMAGRLNPRWADSGW